MGIVTRRRARAASTVALCALAVALAGCAAPTAGAAGHPSADAVPTTTPTPTPLTPAEQLLADNSDTTGACAVSFVLDGEHLDPQLQIQSTLYDHLPIPREAGRAFAGWYADAGAAAAASADPVANAGSPATRVNGARLVDCTDQQQTLYGAWTTPAEAAAVKAKIPILMYHQFTDKPGGESGWLRGNYSYIEDYRASMQYIKDQAFYLPTWDELDAFIDGALFLPDHSVIVTDDDDDQSWQTMASPINEQLQVMATSFVITVYGVPAQNPFILKGSHTDDMHRAGANGKGLMVNLTADQVAADMTTSADKLRAAGVTQGTTEIMAYPFGHTDDTAKQGLTQAGFEMARTIEQGYVKIGTEKLALPCERMNYGMGVKDLKKIIG